MIHDIDQEDLATEQSWENGALAKANPLLGQDWQSMPSKRVRKSLKSTFQIRNFKTKNLICGSIKSSIGFTTKFG
jgi:phage terminase large subunit-like protein